MKPFARLLQSLVVASCAARALGLSTSPYVMSSSSSSSSSSSAVVNRRGFFGSATATVGVVLGSGGAAARATEQEEEKLVDVYFGCGCFWHVQHEFVEAEKKLLGRKDSELTAFAGYAGGLAKDDKVCYHNMMGVQDYGKLGHAEVVGMRIPPSKFGVIAEEYFKLFDEKGIRPDQFGDRGGEYRNLVGFPGGGANKVMYEQLLQASLRTGDRVDFGRGKGDDGDAKALVWVMDNSPEQFPFKIAEPYHQFHDGFKPGENYPDSYNKLAAEKYTAKAFPDSGCPGGLIGLGVAGL